MAKAVLVMDMPETCKDCSCKYPSYKDYALYDCAITGKIIPINGGRYGEKPYWCPLRELPERKPESERRECEGSNMGTWQVPLLENMSWNACLDEITE